MSAATNEAAVMEESTAQASKPAKPAKEEKQAIAYFTIAKNKIALPDFEKAIQSATCEAGRVKAKALAAGKGRIAKDMSGHATLIPSISILKEMEKEGLLGEVNSKEGKERVKRSKDQIKGLNMILDGLALLGLANRKLND